MGATSHSPSLDFAPAPIGRRIQIVTGLVFAVSVAILALILGLVLQEDPGSRGVWIVAAVHLLALGIFWWGARIQTYRVEGGELIVVRRLLRSRFPLAGLLAVEPDPKALQGAWKTIGNDGFGAVSGRFRSRHLGGFRAFLTESAKGVVLRWPEHCVVVSPQDTAHFVRTLKAWTGPARPEPRSLSPVHGGR